MNHAAQLIRDGRVDPDGQTLLDNLPDRHTTPDDGGETTFESVSGVHEMQTQILPQPPRASIESALGTEESGQIGAYRLLERIGTGAMGRVYRAQHTLLGRMVAIKVLRPELATDDAFVTRFFAEARAVNLIDHAHVIDVTDFARDANGTPWFVMELLDGADLGVLQNQEPLGLPRVFEIVRQLCEALNAVHAAGIVHRDVKPENTFISQHEGKDFVKLLDFGVARLPDPTSADPLTALEGMVGTPPYMAPEQVSAGEIDHRVDLYAVGVVLFELITGRTPFKRDDIRVLLGDVVFAVPPVPSELTKVPEVIREDLDALILKCLSKDRNERPNSAQEIAAAVVELSKRLEPRVERRSADRGELVEHAEHVEPTLEQPLVLMLDGQSEAQNVELVSSPVGTLPFVARPDAPRSVQEREIARRGGMSAAVGRAPNRPAVRNARRTGALRVTFALAAGFALWWLPLSLGKNDSVRIVMPEVPSTASVANAQETPMPHGVVEPAWALNDAARRPAIDARAAAAIEDAPLTDRAVGRLLVDEADSIEASATAPATSLASSERHDRRERLRARRAAGVPEVERPVLVVTPNVDRAVANDSAAPKADRPVVSSGSPATKEVDRDLVLNPF